jgi:lysozyme
MTVEDLISKHEGNVSTVYRDSMGIPTIGIGHNLLASPLPTDWTTPLTGDQIDQLFEQDLEAATRAVTLALPWFGQLDPVRSAVVIDMTFNMGIGTLLTFHHTLGFMQSGDWQHAVGGMLSSKWATQVGVRAKEDASMMLSGLWPDDPNFVMLS